MVWVCGSQTMSTLCPLMTRSWWNLPVPVVALSDTQPVPSEAAGLLWLCGSQLDRNVVCPPSGNPTTPSFLALVSLPFPFLRFRPRLLPPSLHIVNIVISIERGSHFTTRPLFSSFEFRISAEAHWHLDWAWTPLKREEH